MLLFDPNPYPSVNMDSTQSFKMLIANFGDNYSQRAGDGLNSSADVADIAWDNLALSEFETMFAFLSNTNGTAPFYFQLVATPYWQKWTCGPIKRSFLSGQTVSMQTTLTEVFDVDPNVASFYGGVPAVGALYNAAGVPVVDEFGNYVLA